MRLYKYLLAIAISIVIICAVVFVMNELYLFQPGQSYVQLDCIGENPTLASLKSESDTILTGTAIGHKRGFLDHYTYTKLAVDQIIFGKTVSKDIIIKWQSGFSESSRFVKGEKYLLFLPEPDENGIYDGRAFTCYIRKYTIILDASGKETVARFAKDIAGGSEVEIDCPESTAPSAYVEDITGKRTEVGPSECKKGSLYVLIEDIIKQIQG